MILVRQITDNIDYIYTLVKIAKISEVYPTVQYKILVGIAVPDGSSC